MTNHCSLNYKFSAWKLQAQYIFLFLLWHSEQFMNTTAFNFHVLNELSFNEQSILMLWVIWCKNKCIWKRFKVEKILKGCQDLISTPSPSVKIQIIGRTVYWAMFCLYTFPAHNLSFHGWWRWWDQIQAIFSNLFYFAFTFFNYFHEILYLRELLPCAIYSSK